MRSSVVQALNIALSACKRRKTFTEALLTENAELILADYMLPSFDGVSALEPGRENRPDTPFVFVSGAIGEEVAIDSLRRGATDYVLKHRLDRLAPAVTRALADANDRKARKAAEAERETLPKREQAARAEADARAHELTQVNAELEQFAYAASHDLQEPLRMVKLYSQLLARRYEKCLDETGTEFIGIIEQGVDRMYRLIEDLLSYSRVSRDKDRNLRPIELDTVVRGALDGLHPRWKKTRQPSTWERYPKFFVTVNECSMCSKRSVEQPEISE
ncbi:MAG: sensor histidine kinase [Bryobacteraceae bacterium]